MDEFIEKAWLIGSIATFLIFKTFFFNTLEGLWQRREQEYVHLKTPVGRFGSQV